MDGLGCAGGSVCVCVSLTVVGDFIFYICTSCGMMMLLLVG